MYRSSLRDSGRRWLPGFPMAPRFSPWLPGFPVAPRVPHSYTTGYLLVLQHVLIQPAGQRQEVVARGPPWFPGFPHGSQGSPVAPRVPHSYTTGYLLVLQHVSVQPAGQRQEVAPRVPPFLHGSVLTSVAACISPAGRTAAGGGSQGSSVPAWLSTY